jgi:transcriptional regulator with XRE-family HTH domain
LQLGLTQLDIELDAELGTGYLQRLESGRVRQPVRTTLERILEALGARYSERREILELFGYMVTSTPPTEEERRELERNRSRHSQEPRQSVLLFRFGTAWKP